MINNTYTFRLLLSFSALLATSAPSTPMVTRNLCDELQKVDWRNHDDWPQAINMIMVERVVSTGEASDDEAMNFVIDQLDILTKPEKMSGELRSKLLRIGEADIEYVHPPNTSFYFFGNTQGSAHCRYDVWAVKNGTKLDPIDGPFDGDDCGASILFGYFGGKSIIIRIRYTPDVPLVGSPPWTVEAVFGNPDEWSEICKLDLNKE